MFKRPLLENFQTLLSCSTVIKFSFEFLIYFNDKKAEASTVTAAKWSEADVEQFHSEAKIYKQSDSNHWHPLTKLEIRDPGSQQITSVMRHFPPISTPMCMD